MSKTVQFEEKEYRAYETIAKKAGFKDVDELFNTALISFLSEHFGWNIKPEDIQKFAKKLREETAKNPDLDIEDFIRNFDSLPIIDKEKVTVEIPKKLLAFLKDRRSKDLDEYLSNCLTDTIASDIDAGCFGHRDQILADYDLKAEFEAYTGH